MQALLNAIYPPRCLLCEERVTQDFALCGACWREVPFITGLACSGCGTPLLGSSSRAEHCDTCLSDPRPWDSALAAMVYEGAGRDFVLRLKHGDRADLARVGGELLAERFGSQEPKTLVAPVPLHWWRLARRRYNQSARIARALARGCGAAWCPDLLRRTRATPSLGGHDHAQRARIMEGVIALHPHRSVDARHIILVDDVMTTGATLDACARAILQAGAASVRVAILARAIKLL